MNNISANTKALERSSFFPRSKIEGTTFEANPKLPSTRPEKNLPNDSDWL
jgi:hypothetical protein